MSEDRFCPCGAPLGPKQTVYCSRSCVGKYRPQYDRTKARHPWKFHAPSFMRNAAERGTLEHVVREGIRR